MATRVGPQQEIADVENPPLPGFEDEVRAIREAAARREAEHLAARRERARESSRRYRARRRVERHRLL